MRMKRILLYLLALAPLSVFAQGGQLNGTGFYRVQNSDTKRYISIVDNHAYRVGTDVDLKAMIMRAENVFDTEVACNPATICYIEMISSSALNLVGQGLNLSDYGYYLNVMEKNNGSYVLYGSTSGISLYLLDNTRSYSPMTMQGGTTGKRNWWFLPVDQSDSQYFGVMPDVTASVDGSYWATMYAGFPFKPSAATTKVYTVSKVDNALGCAVITEITDNVPAQTPVLFRCGSATPIGNKLTLLNQSTSGSVGTNYLNGNYYCNDVEYTAERNHRNVKEYNPSTMRMLGTTADGKPAFVKSNIQYLPANKCFLAVSSTAPDVLKIMTEAEYEAYVTGIEQITTSTTDGAKVIYDLQGRRVQAPSKGLYIVNGKKMIIK